MRFGLVIPQGWFSDINDLYTIKDIAREAEKLGFNSLYVYDHLLPYNKYTSIEEPILEGWTLLSSLIGITNNINLGTLVLCNSYRNPALLAKMGATFDYLSNGRLIFGIGTGWYEEEYKRFGYTFYDAKTRLEQLDEALYIIRGLWSNKRFNYNGKYYNIDAICNPSTKRIRIMVGGSSKYLLVIANKHADIYNCPFSSPEAVSKKIKILSNKRIEISVLINAVIGKEDEINKIISNIKRKDESIKGYLTRVSNYTLINKENIDLLNKYIEIGVEEFIIHLHAIDIFRMSILMDIIKTIK